MSTVVDPKVKDSRAEEFAHVPEEKEQESKFQYPGIPVTCDGSEAVVHVEIAVCHGSGAYPITSSTTMGAGFNAAVNNGNTNLWAIRSSSWSPKASTLRHRFAKGLRWRAGE
jgi:hypothetical protein